MNILTSLVVTAVAFGPADLRGTSAQEAGALVICGGGSMPDEIFTEFRRLAGDANLVVIPTASSRKPDVKSIVARWQTRGFSRVQVMHTQDSQTAASDAFRRPLQAAGAVWFGGGSQQRIADAYVGTPVEQDLHALLTRGGVIGGTSAGAAIQSRVMIASGRGVPRISQGLDLLPEAIIDQHFLRRDRIGRLMQAVRLHPGRTGYGIDEGTALVVRGEQAKVVGRSYVLQIRSGQEGLTVRSYGRGDTIRMQARKQPVTPACY